eukprot:SAG31_NODE_3250_length_4490_cov_3.521977_5_plen_393_part_00
MAAPPLHLSQPLCVALLAALLAAAAPAPVPRSYWPTSAWRSATPESQGMSSAALKRAAKLVEFYNLNAELKGGTAEMTSHADAFMVVKGGYIVAEHYWGSTTNETMHDLESTTKSISSALIAHAIKRGVPKLRLGVKTPVSKFYDIKVLTPAAASAPLLLENVISMSGGMNGSYWGTQPGGREWFGHCRDWNRAFRQGTGPDAVESGQFVADHGLLKKPGSSFVYSWTNTGLASGIFTKATGMSLAAWATRPGGLFEQIGIRNGTFRWMTNKFGESQFDGMSYHKLRNLARFGLLMVSGGSWDGEQLLDEDYVKAISKPTPNSVGGCADYRHFFWHKPLGGVPKDAMITWGGGGQVRRQCSNPHIRLSSALLSPHPSNSVKQNACYLSIGEW